MNACSWSNRGVLVALLAGVLFLPSVMGATGSEDFDPLRRQGREHLKRGEWAAALHSFGRIPIPERSSQDHDSYQTSLRHVLQTRRLRDRTLQALVLPLLPSQALNGYREVLEVLQARYIDKSRVLPTDLFYSGVLELRTALEDEVFSADHLMRLRPEVVSTFKGRLDALLVAHAPLGSIKEARDQFHSILQAAQALGLRPGVVLLEFICGACHSLDEYTLYLGPSQVQEAEAERDGRVISVGLELVPLEQRLVLSRVYRNSPADEADLRPGDVLVSIDGMPVDPSMPAAALARLAGDDGTPVDVQVVRFAADGSGSMTAMQHKLIRRPVMVPSVEVPEESRDLLRERNGIGYIRISSFAKATSHELKEAILDLSARLGGLKALVIDLRGNLGGTLPSALQVAELFLRDGLIGFQQGRQREDPQKVQNPGAFTMPLVLLVDGETASAAEVVAAALKERGRATLVGQKTFGKGSIQDIYRLDLLKAGLRMTIARFRDPAHGNFERRGILPHQEVERTGPPNGDAQREAAYAVAERLLTLVPR